jgi:hypothetical protein
MIMTLLTKIKNKAAETPARKKHATQAAAAASDLRYSEI